MKALGVGTAAGMLSGAASGQTNDDDDGAGDGGQADDDGQMADDNTVHVVRTLIGPSTSPERPADFFYQPTGLAIEPGDVVRFVFQTPDHTVTSYHPAFGMQRRLPSGVGPISAPIMGWDPDSLPDDIDEPPAVPGEGGDEGNGMDDDSGGGEDGENGDGQAQPRPTTWLHAFDTPGVYDLECAPHEGFGMAMRIVVGDRTDTDFETSDPSALPAPRAGPVGLARVTLTDPNLEPDVIYQEGRVEWQALEVNQQAPPAETDTEAGTETEAETGTETQTETSTGTQTETGG
jgi:plastocyanin